MDILIVSGFLGSGKTTLILKYLESIQNEHKKVSILENDFGSSNYDASWLKQVSSTSSSRFSVEELTAGCICCSLNDAFRQAIDKIIQIDMPDLLIIEPSGVASLSELKKTLAHMSVLCVTLVDLKNYAKNQFNFGDLFDDQIKSADLLLFTHDENQIEFISEVSKLNPNAIVIRNYTLSFPVTFIHEMLTNPLKLLHESTVKPLVISPLEVSPFNVVSSQHQHSLSPINTVSFNRHGQLYTLTAITINLRAVFDERVIHLTPFKDSISFLLNNDDSDQRFIRIKGTFSTCEGDYALQYNQDDIVIYKAEFVDHQMTFIGTQITESYIFNCLKGGVI